MKPCIVLGGGGHGRVLVDALIACGAPIIGITDPKHVRAHNVPYLGSDDVVSQYSTDEILLVNGLGSVGDPRPRESAFERFRSLGYSFKTVVHPAAVVSPRSKLCQGVQVMAGAIVQAGVKIGDNSIVNTGAIVDHDCVIGAHVHIAPGAVLSGSVSVGDRAHIGTGAQVRDGVSIGAGAIVGVGAAVTRSIPAGRTAVGVPAKVRDR